MKKFVFKVLAISVSFISLFLLLVVLFSLFVERNDFKNWETESNLLVIKPDTNYNLLFLGNSHARNFSRYHNQERVEKILNKTILNLGRTGGKTGYTDYLFYLEYVYSKNITFDTIIVNIFSQMLYSNTNDLSSNTFDDEPFVFDFFFKYLKYPYSNNKGKRMFYYMRSKLNFNWLKTVPYSLDEKSDELTFIDTAAINKGMKNAFIDGVDTSRFNYNCKIVEKIINTAQEHNAVVIFITTPTLFGNWPYYEDVNVFMRRMEASYGIKYYNFAITIPKPEYYYDHHHLNTKGVVYFVSNFLNPVLNSNDSTYLVR